MGYLYRREIDPSEIGCIRFLIRAIFDCYKPLESEVSYWESFKDEDNVWRKKKVELTEKEISDRLTEKKMFLSDSKLIKMMDGETIAGCYIQQKELLNQWDDYLKNKCDGTVYFKILKKANLSDITLLDD